MKTILIRRVNVISVLRNTLSPLVIIGLAAGVLMGIFLTASSFPKKSITHISWSEIIGITLIMGAKGFLASYRREEAGQTPSGSKLTPGQGN